MTTLTMSQVRKAGCSTPAQNAMASLLVSLKIPYEENKQFVDFRTLSCTGCHKRVDFDRFVESQMSVFCGKCGCTLTFGSVFPDFYINTNGKKIILQVDGKIHEKGKHPQRDRDQDEYLRANYGVEIHRFRNETVLKDTELVLRYLEMLLGVRKIE